MVALAGPPHTQAEKHQGAGSATRAARALAAAPAAGFRRMLLQVRLPPVVLAGLNVGALQ